MGQLAAGWKVISIYDPATGTVVQLNSLLPETDVTVKPIFVETPSGLEFGGFSAEANFEFYDDAGFTQLRTWFTNFTPVRAVGVGSTVNLQWYESVTLKNVEMVRTPDARTGLHRFRVQMVYAGDLPAIYMNRNLLAYLGWNDANADGIPEGYTNASIPTVAFNNGNGEFTATNMNDASDRLEATIIFPIAGVTLVKSVFAVSSSIQQGVRLRSQTFAGTNLLDSSNYVTSSNIINSLSYLTPAGIYWIYASPCRSGTASTNSSVQKFPALTTDGSRTPGTSFMNN